MLGLTAAKHFAALMVCVTTFHHRFVFHVLKAGLFRRPIERAIHVEASEHDVPGTLNLVLVLRRPWPDRNAIFRQEE